MSLFDPRRRINIPYNTYDSRVLERENGWKRDRRLSFYPGNEAHMSDPESSTVDESRMSESEVEDGAESQGSATAMVENIPEWKETYQQFYIGNDFNTEIFYQEPIFADPGDPSGLFSMKDFCDDIVKNWNEIMNEAPNRAWNNAIHELINALVLSGKSKIMNLGKGIKIRTYDKSGKTPRLDIALGKKWWDTVKNLGLGTILEKAIEEMRKVQCIVPYGGWPDCHLMIAFPGTPAQRAHRDAGDSECYATAVLPLVDTVKEAGYTQFTGVKKPDQVHAFNFLTMWGGGVEHFGSANESETPRIFLYFVLNDGFDPNFSSDDEEDGKDKDYSGGSS